MELIVDEKYNSVYIYKHRILFEAENIIINYKIYVLMEIV